MPLNRQISALLAACALLAAGQGCQQKNGGVHEIETTRMATKPHAPAATDMPSAERFGFAPAGEQMAASAPAAADAKFDFQLPEGWVELPQQPMREINLAVNDAPQTECFVSVLSSSGGGLAANVNRWRQQMGLAPESEESIGVLPLIEVLGREGRLVELEGTYSGMRGDQNGEGYKMLAAYVPTTDQLVTIKMIGPADQVTAQRDNFIGFAMSLKPAGAPAQTAQTDHGRVTSEGTVHETADDLAFDVPSEWKRAGERPMRLITYMVDGTGETECYISTLSGTGGGLEANLNRWQGQMGQPPLDAAAIASLPKLNVLGQEAPLLEVKGTFSGMRGGTKPNYALAGVFVTKGDTSYSIKLIGPQGAVARNMAAFTAFCETLHTH